MTAINDILRSKRNRMRYLKIDDKSPCPDVNPVLWGLFCARTNREMCGSTQTVWTEADVVELFLSDFAMREADLVA